MTHLAKFQEKLKGLADAALIASWQNQFYVTDFRYDDGYVLILPDAAYVLADFRYIEVAKNSVSTDFTVIQPESSMNETVRDLLQKHN